MNILFVRGLLMLSSWLTPNLSDTIMILDQWDESNQDHYRLVCDKLWYAPRWYRGDYTKWDMMRQICRDQVVDLVVYDMSDSSNYSWYQPFIDHISWVAKMCQHLCQLWVMNIMIFTNWWVDDQATWSIVCHANQLMMQSLSHNEWWNVVIVYWSSPKLTTDMIWLYHHYVWLAQRQQFPQYEYRMV